MIDVIKHKISILKYGSVSLSVFESSLPWSDDAKLMDNLYLMAKSSFFYLSGWQHGVCRRAVLL